MINCHWRLCGSFADEEALDYDVADAGISQTSSLARSKFRARARQIRQIYLILYNMMNRDYGDYIMCIMLYDCFQVSTQHSGRY